MAHDDLHFRSQMNVLQLLPVSGFFVHKLFSEDAFMCIFKRY